MSLPKICYSKIFWTIIFASFGFTSFVYGILNENIRTIEAINLDQTEITSTVPIMYEKIANVDEKTDKLLEDVSYIKGKLEKED